MQPASNQKELFFFSYPMTNVDHNWIESYALKLNNKLALPMRILNIKERLSTSKTTVEYYIVVEECLDEKEWQILAEAWITGMNAASELDQALKKAKGI